MRNPRTILAAAATLGLAVAALTSAGASAHEHHGSRDHGGGLPSTTSHTLADGLLTPLRAAVAPDGTTYVTQNFAGLLMRIPPGGTPQVAYTDPDGREVGSVSVSGNRVYFTVTASDPVTHENAGSWLMRLNADGTADQIADINAYETAANPDQVTMYGFRNAATIDPTCAAQWPAQNGPLTYPGQVDSHPYATSQVGHGWTYVADAGANAVFRVSPGGHVSTAAVLPAIPYKVTADGATASGIPSCFVGQTYWFEPVPTDVEPGPEGSLYVSSLPGGPEGPALGARGSVFRVDPGTEHHSWHGHVHQVVRGLLGPTGIAPAPDGSLYVAQLFGDEISRVTFGHGHGHDRSGHGHGDSSCARVSDFSSVTGPAEVEWGKGGLYATTNSQSGTDGTSAPAGMLVLYPSHGSHHH